jgi:hypothetical protein
MVVIAGDGREDLGCFFAASFKNKKVINQLINY